MTRPITATRTHAFLSRQGPSPQEVVIRVDGVAKLRLPVDEARELFKQLSWCDLEDEEPVAPRTFDSYPLKHPCRRCGCPRDEHRIGSMMAGVRAPHSCPSIVEKGVALPFPRKVGGEPETEYRRRVAAYWAEPCYEGEP
jgi:hypothetical protein